MRGDPSEASAGRSKSRVRASELGLDLGDLPRGPHNALSDVRGVRVGHTTVRRPPDVHTGVTAVLPGEVSPRRPLPAAVFSGNGYGKLIGSTQLEELGVLETPLLLTSTLCAFSAADALVGWMLERPDCAEVRSLNPVVGECNDGWLSDIRARPVQAAHVRAALDRASGGPVAEGCVGAGTGTGALGFKAGIGTSSRRLTMRPSEVAGAVGEQTAGAQVTLGALVQANFGGTLRLAGLRLTPDSLGLAHSVSPAEVADEGSCMIVIATDAPLDARQLARVARRAVFALGRVGASYGHGSGDYAVALSTVSGTPPADADLNPFFEATLDVVEEAVLNSLLAADTTTGQHGRTLPALPAWKVRRLLTKPNSEGSQAR